MGTIVRAVCECGYAREMLCGGGMANFESVCLFPVYCRTCGLLEAANLFDAPLRCPKCGTDHVIAYDHHELVGQKGKEEVFSWNVKERIGRNPRLSDGHYLCPACQRMQLRFQESGYWD